ncbi:MAG: hypothetical protein ACYS1A_03650 [Planctomycetota bacterium]|jgi:hypothetical protein
MKTKKLLFYLLAVILGGCVPSLNSLFTENELIFEENLLGTWAEDDSRETWQFKRGSDDPNNKFYEMTYTDSNGKGVFFAGLGKINDVMFLNIYPHEPELDKTNDFYKFHILRVNTFMKIEQIEPTLKMAMMSPDTIKEMLENDPNIIEHKFIENGERILLTASTKQLQQFMKEHANDKDLFDEPVELKRLIPKDPDDANDADPNDS